MEERLENLFKRQEEMEKNINVYLRAATLKHGQTSKRKHSKSGETEKDHNKWLTF
jgi:hypothetical protein